MRFFVAFEPERLRQQAAASTQRWAEGRPLSPLDGVPFAGQRRTGWTLARALSLWCTPGSRPRLMHVPALARSAPPIAAPRPYTLRGRRAHAAGLPAICSHRP